MATVNTTPADLGAVTGYAIAVEKGYKGTLNDWVQLQLNGAAAYQQMTDDVTSALDNKIVVGTTAPTSTDSKVWIDTTNTGTVQIPEVKDNQVSDVDTWSSQKIDGEFSNLKNGIDNENGIIGKGFFSKNAVEIGTPSAGKQFGASQNIGETATERSASSWSYFGFDVTPGRIYEFEVYFNLGSGTDRNLAVLVDSSNRVIWRYNKVGEASGNLSFDVMIPVEASKAYLNVTYATQTEAVNRTHAYVREYNYPLTKAVVDLQGSIGYKSFADDLILNRYIEVTGELATYSTWSATPFVSCDGLKKLFFISSVASKYNAFYSTADESAFISAFRVEEGESVVDVPENAKYFRLSNTTAAMQTESVSGLIKSEIETLKSFNSRLFPEVRTLSSIEWEQGYYSSNGTAEGSTSDIAIRSTASDFIQCGKGSKISLKSVANGERVRFCRYYTPNEDSFIDRIARTVTSTYTFEYDCYIRIYVFYTDNRVIEDQSALIDNVVLHAIQYGYATADMLDKANERIDSLDEKMPALPTAWTDKVQAIQTAQKDKFTFAIQTDTHYYIGYGKDAGQNLKLLTNFVGFDFVANLGDVIRGYSDETIDSDVNMRSAMTEIINRYITSVSCPFMVAMGNHDNNPLWANAFSGAKFSNAEIWGRMFKPAFNTNVRAVTQTGLMYYYTDFNDVRVIVLNTQDGSNQNFGIGTSQLSWLTNTALNTDKYVLIMSHVPLVDGWSVSSNYVSDYANVVSALQTFKTNGGKLIGCMSGHTHTQESKTIDGILYVTFRNSGFNAEVVMVDLSAKTIETICLGFNGDRSLTFS